MAISQFPAPSAAGGGGAGLPIGATALEFGGKLTGAGYSHPGTLTAGKYIIECDNTVKVTLGDNAQEFFVEPGETIDLAVDESNFFVEPKAVLAGPAQLVDTYPVPAIYDNRGATRAGHMHFNETTGDASAIYGRSSSNAVLEGYYRDSNTGSFMEIYSGTSKYSFSCENNANSGWQSATVSKNDGTVLVFAKINNSRVYVYTCDVENNTVSLVSLNAGTEVTQTPASGYGFAGAAISADGQTIVAPYQNSTYALVSTDGGATWSSPDLGVTTAYQSYADAWSIWWVHDRFVLRLSTGANFAHSTDGTNWTQVAIAGASGYVSKPARSDLGTWVFGTDSTNNTLWTTTDLSSFTAVTHAPSIGNYPWDGGFSYADGKFIGLTHGGGGQPTMSVSTDDGATWFDITQPAAGYGNTPYGTNPWIYAGNTRYISFTSGYWSQVLWDAKWETWIVPFSVYDTGTTTQVVPAMSINTDDYYRWAWSVAASTPIGSAPMWDEVGNKAYYTASYYWNRSEWGIEYEPSTGKVRTLPPGESSNPDWFSSSTQDSAHAVFRLQTDTDDKFVTVWTTGLYQSLDFDNIVPTFSQVYTWASGYGARAWQWPDGSINVFTGNTNTSYVRNVYAYKQVSGNIPLGAWHWQSSTSYYEDEVFAWASGAQVWFPIVNTTTGTFSAADSGRYVQDASYPVTNFNLGAQYQTNYFQRWSGHGDGGFEWRYYSADYGTFKAGLNVSSNGGAVWANVPAFAQYAFTYATRVIEGTVYFIVREPTGNLMAVYKANSVALGDWEKLFNLGFDDNKKWLATMDTTFNQGGGMYRPDLGDDDLYLSKGAYLFKIFGSTSKPDTNLFVYNATNEVL